MLMSVVPSFKMTACSCSLGDGNSLLLPSIPHFALPAMNEAEMGCAQSRIENEEAVSRCKDRRQFMKDAVAARNAFAVAHSAYVVALKNIGAALSDFGQGEAPDAAVSAASDDHVGHSSSGAPFATMIEVCVGPTMEEIAWVL